MSVTRDLAQFAASLTFEALPPAAVRCAKHLTLDTLGTALAAVTLGDGCTAVADVMERLGGPAESAILGRDARVAAPHAAFANGALAHALNYDAVGAETGHTGVACFAAPFALAQATAPVDGRRYLTAVVAAAEVTARLVRAARGGTTGIAPAVLSGQYFSYLGAAAGAAHVLALDAARTHSAFGLALMQAAGSRQVVIGGDPPAKAIYGAFPSHAGVLAALLARAGLAAEIDAVDGPAGVFAGAAGGTFDAALLTGGLGRDFAFTDVQFKPWAVSNHVMPFIEAALAIRAAGDVRADDIAAIELAGARSIVDWFEPLAERRHPRNAAAAANSTMFAVAHAFVHGDVTLAAFTAAGMSDGAVARLADRITYRIDDAVRGGSVDVRARDGRRTSVAVDRPLGDPSRPLSRERLEAKFRDCCTHAPGLQPGDADALIRAIDALETLPDAGAAIGGAR